MRSLHGYIFDDNKNHIKIPDGIKVKDWDDAFNFINLFLKMEKINEHYFIISLMKEVDE